MIGLGSSLDVVAVWLRFGAVLSSLAVCCPSLAIAQGTEGVTTVRVATGLQRPVFVTAPPEDFDRLFVAEQHSGQVRILRLSDDTLDPQPFLDLDGITTGGEQGLLGLAFHPDYATNGYLFVNVTDNDGGDATRILRFRVSADPDVVDPDSQLEILSFSQPQTNHNGGWIGFGPDDGFLYIATGDGGSSNDSGTGHATGTGNGQATTDNLLGKILRIDVDGDDFPQDTERNYAIPADNPFVDAVGDDEIWAYGLRNPYRASFDRATGDLYIGDVGQKACEEISLLRSDLPGGQNLGWRLREGTIATPTGGVGGDKPAGALDPIMDYPRPGGQSSSCSGPPAEFVGTVVTGGVVYNGPAPSIRGRYFFADFATSEIWSFVYDDSDPSSFDGRNYTDLTNHVDDPAFVPDEGTISSISSFGEDARGNLYVTDLFGGEVFRVPEPGGLASHVIGLLTVVGAVRWRRLDARRIHPRTSRVGLPRRH